MPELDSSNARQPFEQVADYYRQQIATGKLQPGDQLPSVREIARSFRVAGGTVANAIKVLRDDDLITSWQGRGMFVRDPAKDGEPDPATTYEVIMVRLDEIQAAVEDVAGRVSRLEAKGQGKER